MHRFNLAGFSVALLVALTHAGVSFARPPFGPPDVHRGPGNFIEENVETLDLDEETLTAIRAIVEESRETGDQFHAELREHSFERGIGLRHVCAFSLQHFAIYRFGDVLVKFGMHPERVDDANETDCRRKESDDRERCVLAFQ